jgi:hypothetical protein
MSTDLFPTLLGFAPSVLDFDPLGRDFDPYGQTFILKIGPDKLEAYITIGFKGIARIGAQANIGSRGCGHTAGGIEMFMTVQDQTAISGYFTTPTTKIFFINPTRHRVMHQKNSIRYPGFCQGIHYLWISQGNIGLIFIPFTGPTAVEA